MTQNIDFSQVIRTERMRRGLTQAELGERVGVSDSYIAHLESGLKTPSPNLAFSLAEEFGFTMQQRQAMLEAVEDARLERTSRRIRTRGRVIRGALQMRSLPDSGVVLLVDPATGATTETVPLPGRALRLLCFSPTGRLLAGSDDQGGTTLWDLTGPAPARAAEFGETPLAAIAFSGDSQHIVCADEDSTISRWDTTGRKVSEFAGGVGRITALATSPVEEDLIAIGDEDGQLALCVLTQEKQRWMVDAHRGSLESLAFAPDGDRVASSGEADGKVRIWRARNGKEEHALHHDGGVHALCFSPDSRALACAGQGLVTLWNPDDAPERRAFYGPRAAVRHVAFHTRGDRITALAADGSAFTWDMRTGVMRNSVQVAGAPFPAHALSSDAQRVALFDAKRAPGEDEPSAESIARELAHDRDLLNAWRDLRAGLANPAMRETILNALRAFARRS